MSPKSDKPLPGVANLSALQGPKPFAPSDFVHPASPTSRRYYNAYRAANPRRPARHESCRASSKRERKLPICLLENRNQEKIAPCSPRPGATRKVNNRRPLAGRHAVLPQTATSSAISNARMINSIALQSISNFPLPLIENCQIFPG